MGLDITAHEKVGEFIGDEEPEDWQNHHHVYANEDFPDQADGLESGWYRNVKGAQVHSFRAGSYSGYGYFRAEVIEAISGLSPDRYWENEEYEGTPLRAWLYFSDCDGVIGPKTSARLYQEALEVSDIVVEHMKKLGEDQGEYYVYLWNNWVEAFKLAADTGCVVFH